MLIPSYDPHAGGADRQLAGLLQWIDRDRFTPFVLTRMPPPGRRAHVSGLTPVVHIPSPWLAKTFFVPALRYLWKRRKDYDVIHVHSLEAPALAAALVKRVLSKKTFVLRVPDCGAGSTFDRLSTTRGGRARLRFVLSKADVVISPCPDAAKALAEAGAAPEKCAGIPNGVDTQHFMPASEAEKCVLKRSFGIPEDAFVTIAVARLVPRTNLTTALEAWKRVCASRPDSVLIVAGNGPEGPRLSAYADAELDGHSVMFTGATSRDEVTRLLRTADAYISYARHQGTSDAMLEAMSSGLPVVAARSPGSDQLVRHTKNGFVFDLDHPMDGADYLLRLAEDPDLATALAVTARDMVESSYSFEHITRSVERLYDEGPRAFGGNPPPTAPVPRQLPQDRFSQSQTTRA
jgi:glycosyltransferase involved in cell wall biosynthesis